MLITSKQNSKIKDAAKLKMKKYRDETGKFLIEGFYPIKFALKNNHPLEELLVCKKLLREKFDNSSIISQIEAKNLPVTEVSEDVFMKISSFESPEGLVAIAPKTPKYLKDHILQERGIYVVIESIEKLGNLGAIFRLVDNAGASGVIICDMRADMYNPESIRSSVGTFFSVNILQASTEEAIEWCKQNNIKTLATSPQGSEIYTRVDLTGPIAVVMGTEYAGLSNTWMENANVKIKIPMFGQANSLSVTASTAVMLYEAVRQRGL